MDDLLIDPTYPKQPKHRTDELLMNEILSFGNGTLAPPIVIG